MDAKISLISNLKGFLQALEEDHSGVYKLRLMNISGVFESVAEVNIEGPPGKQKKVKKEEKKKVEAEVSCI